jgi:hypothetical protein
MPYFVFPRYTASSKKTYAAVTSSYPTEKDILSFVEDEKRMYEKYLKADPREPMRQVAEKEGLEGIVVLGVYLEPAGLFERRGEPDRYEDVITGRDYNARSHRLCPWGVPLSSISEPYRLFKREFDDGCGTLTISYFFHRQRVATLSTPKERFGGEAVQHSANRLPVLQEIQKMFGIDPLSSEASSIWEAMVHPRR